MIVFKAKKKNLRFYFLYRVIKAKQLDLILVITIINFASILISKINIKRDWKGDVIQH
jgi:hypothetical protein